jgi:hypothetical protein
MIYQWPTPVVTSFYFYIRMYVNFLPWDFYALCTGPGLSQSHESTGVSTQLSTSRDLAF